MQIRIVYISVLALLFILQSCKKDDRPYHNDGDVSKFMYNNPDGINIVVLGDGFIKADLREGGKFDQKVKEYIDYLFTIEPFKQYKNYFNVYQVFAESKVRGAANKYIPGRTAFDTYFGTVNDRYLVTGNYESSYSYAAKAVPLSEMNLLVVISNDDRIGGTANGIATISTSQDAKQTLLHEVGHVFAGLGDEYTEEAIAENYSLQWIPYLPNLDNTSDVNKIKWSHFINNNAYQKWVGVFEGGYYRSKGVYRPQYSSIMYNNSYPWFNAPSREAIVRSIDYHLGIPFDLEAFLKDDAKNIAPPSIFVQHVQVPNMHNDFIDIKQRAAQLHLQRVNAKKLN